MSCLTRDHPEINPYLWTTSYLQALLNRKDTRGIKVPVLWEILPSEFIPIPILKEAEMNALTGRPQQSQVSSRVKREFGSDVQVNTPYKNQN